MRNDLVRSNFTLGANATVGLIQSSQRDRLVSMIHALGRLPNEFLGGVDRSVCRDGQEWTVRQIQVLDSIDRCSGASQTMIAHSTGIDRSTLCEMVHRLGRRGLISRMRARSDRRSHSLNLTEEGRKVLEDGRKVLDDLEEALFKRLSPVEAEAFLELLEKVVGASRE
jgi:DNA-binding MarR family transcriptional regulator